MKRFIVKFSNFFGIFFILILLIAFCLEMIIKENIKGKQFMFHADWTSKVNENYQILFLGNSRVWAHINAELISNKTNSKAYNLTQNSKSIKFLWYKFQNYLKYNAPPKDLFLQFDNKFISDLYKKPWPEKENFLTYIYKNPLNLNELFQKEVGFTEFDTHIPIIRYYGYPSVFYSHITGKTNCDLQHTKKSYQYGYEGQKANWNEFKSVDEPNSPWNYPLKKDYNTLHLNYADSFRIYCQLNNVKLHLFYPPISYSSYEIISQKDKDELLNYIMKHQIDYHDFNSIIFNDSTIFYNHTHLNNLGSSIFTNLLIERYFEK